MEKSAFERAIDRVKRAEKSALTAGYDGRALATLTVNQDARARIAHGAKRALVARNPVTEPPMADPVTKRVDGLAAFLDCACGDSLRTSRWLRHCDVLRSSALAPSFTKRSHHPPHLGTYALRSCAAPPSSTDSKTEGRSAPVTRATSPPSPRGHSGNVALVAARGATSPSGSAAARCAR